MNQEKQTMTTNPNLEHGQEPRSYVALDFRTISLATFLSGMASVIIIGIFSTFEQSQIRKFALSGSWLVLEKADKVASLVAILTAVSKIQTGTAKLVEVLPRNNSGFVRAVSIAVVLTFIRGSLEYFVQDKIFEWDGPMDMPQFCSCANATASTIPSVTPL